MRSSLMAFLVLAGMVSLGASAARASTTEITLSSGSASATSTLSYTSLDFNGWTIDIGGTSTTSPNQITLQGVPPSLDFSISCFVTACEGDPLTVEFSSTGFTGGAPGFFTTYDLNEVGSSPSSTQTGSYGTTSIGTITFTGTVVNGSTTLYGGSAPGGYSLSIEDVFNAGGGAAAFDGKGFMGATPELGTMVLFGSGLVLFGGVLRRRLLA
jgi:hypothetical protein